MSATTKPARPVASPRGAGRAVLATLAMGLAMLVASCSDDEGEQVPTVDSEAPATSQQSSTSSSTTTSTTAVGGGGGGYGY